MIDELLLCFYFKRTVDCKGKDFDREIAQENAAVKIKLAAKYISNGREYFGFAEVEGLEIYKGCEKLTPEQYSEEKRNKSCCICYESFTSTKNFFFFRGNHRKMLSKIFHRSMQTECNICSCIYNAVKLDNSLIASTLAVFFSPNIKKVPLTLNLGQAGLFLLV